MNFSKIYSLIANLIVTFFITISLFSCQRKKEIIKNTTYSTQQVDKYYQLANKYYDSQKFDSAYFYANKIRLEINPEKELKKYTTNMFILAMSQQLHGEYSGAQSTIVETLSSIENLNSDLYNFKFYAMLGYNHISLQDHKNALYYYNKALTYKVKRIRKIAIEINIGCLYITKKNYGKALEIFQNLINNPESKKNKYYYSGIINNYGYCLFKTKKKHAYIYLKKSLELYKNMDSTADDDYDLTSTYFHLYEYFLNKDKNKALEYTKLLYKKASEYKNPDDTLLALSLLIKQSTAKESKDYALKYVKLNDSITEVRQKAKNYFAKLKYDSKKEKEENLKLKAEKELQQELERNKNIVITFIIIIIILLSAFIYHYLIEKNKKEKIQTSYNTEIRIAKKLHDELANEIFQTINFAETQDLSSPEISGKLLENLDSIYSTTRNISKENNQIETGEQFENDLKEMITSFGSKTVNIIINNLEEINWKKTSKLKKIAIYRVIQELLVNMKKHSQSNLVLISFKTQENNLLLNYYDNGKGIDFKQTKKKSGLYNIENRIKAINGTITFDSNQNKGVKTSIVIPL